MATEGVAMVNIERRLSMFMLRDMAKVAVSFVIGITPAVAKSVSENCSSTHLGESIASLEAIIQDVKTHYNQHGGEIVNIQLLATDNYVIPIAQEERVDKISYKVKVESDCAVTILNKELSAVTPRPGRVD